jgi:hypothetical protein
MTRGGLLGLAIAGGAIVVVAVVLVVVLVRVFTGDAKAPTARVASEGAEVAKEGMRAAGTDELRKLGCDQALVVDMQRLLGDAGRFRDGEPRTMVTCDVTQAASAPTCERVAGAYFTAIGGTAEAAVAVRVLLEGTIKPTCSRLYAPSGADLGPFPRN